MDWEAEGLLDDLHEGEGADRHPHVAVAEDEVLGGGRAVDAVAGRRADVRARPHAQAGGLGPARVDAEARVELASPVSSSAVADM